MQEVTFVNPFGYSLFAKVPVYEFPVYKRSSFFVLFFVLMLHDPGNNVSAMLGQIPVFLG